MDFKNVNEEKKYIIETNLLRRHLSVVAKVKLLRKLEPIEAESARERQEVTQFGGGVNISTTDKGKTRDIMGAKIGISGVTYDKIVAILDSGKPDLIKNVEEGKTSISYASQSLNLQQKHAKPPPLPEGLFDVILADPPWRYSFTAVSGNPEEQYPTMTLDDLCNLKIPSAKDSILFLWATNPLIREALKVVEAWGYEYLTNLVWIKNGLGIGHYVRGDHELLLIGKKGNIPAPEEENRPSSVLKADKRGHSRKPDETYAIIEKMYPNRIYLELFARPETIREKWVYWGLEVERQKLEK
jgi:N6-adenosine-specific RNA methylase IME4